MRRRPRQIAGLLHITFVATCCSGHAAFGQATLTEITPFPGATESYADAVSRDGLVIVGMSGPVQGDYDHAFRWSAAHGMEDLGNGQFPYVADYFQPAGLSDDGAVVAGIADTYLLAHQHGFRWTLQGGMQDLGTFAPDDVFNVGAISGDGQVVVGYYAGSADQAFLWNGEMSPIPGFFTASAVSRDGTTVLGKSVDGQFAYASLWTAAGGTEHLGLFEPTGMSDDGSVAVGKIIALYDTPVRWTRGAGVTNLQIPPGVRDIDVFAVSGNGAIAVGAFAVAAIPYACMWMPDGTVQNLNTYVPTLGVDLTGWSLQKVLGVNEDGSVMVGDGRLNGQPRGWVLRLHPTCTSADFNHDGDAATDADIEDFFSCLAGNCCPTCYGADIKGDGDTGTDADIEAFFRVLAGGNC